MNLGRYSAWLALGFGPLLLVQACLRYSCVLNGWLLADALGCLCLLGAALWALRGDEGAPCRALAGAWGYAAGTLGLSFLVLTPLIDAPTVQEGQAGWLVATGWLFITALIGLGGSVAGNQNARR